MDQDWFLKLGWSVFQHSAGQCDESAERAFQERYGPTAKAASKDFSDNPALFGEVLSWLVWTASTASQFAGRHGGPVNGTDVLAAADAAKQISGTTYC